MNPNSQDYSDEYDSYGQQDGASYCYQNAFDGSQINYSQGYDRSEFGEASMLTSNNLVEENPSQQDRSYYSEVDEYQDENQQFQARSEMQVYMEPDQMSHMQEAPLEADQRPLGEIKEESQDDYEQSHISTGVRRLPQSSVPTKAPQTSIQRVPHQQTPTPVAEEDELTVVQRYRDAAMKICHRERQQEQARQQDDLEQYRVWLNLIKEKQISVKTLIDNIKSERKKRFDYYQGLIEYSEENFQIIEGQK